MEKLPTAEEFLMEKYSVGLDSITHMPDHLIEFAKLHVKAALQNAVNNVSVNTNYEFNGESEIEVYDGINKDSILDSYPEENIK